MPIEIYMKNMAEGKVDAHPDSHDLDCKRKVVIFGVMQGTSAHKCTELCVLYKEVMLNIHDADRVYSLFDNYERRHSHKP